MALGSAVASVCDRYACGHRRGTQLLQESQIISDGRMLDHLPGDDAQHVDVSLGKASASRRDAPERALVGAAHRRLQDDLVALGDHVVDGPLEEAVAYAVG